MPPMRPMAKAAPHSTFPQPAVTDTNPPRIPPQKAPTSYLLMIANFTRKAMRPPADADMVVFIATWAAMKPCSIPTMLNVEPQLNPYQPNQRMNVPRMTSGMLCGANGSFSFSGYGLSNFPMGSLNLPFRGLEMLAPTSAPTPP